MRILGFFGYVAAMIAVPAVVLAIAQLFIGPLQWPPPAGYGGRLPTGGEVTAVALFTGGWVLAQFFLFGRIAAWAAAVSAVPGVRAVPLGDLAARLAALNALPVPWTIGPGRRADELVIDWRYGDATWLDPMRAHRLSRTWRLVIRLDTDRPLVRAVERFADFDASAGAAPLAATLRWRTSRGINFFQVRHERVFGLQFRDGRPTADLSYAYTFSLHELKAPIIRLVTESGWEYRSVLTFFRLIGRLRW